MKADIHPKYHQITVKCSCGHEFTTGSALDVDSLTIEVCSSCHPYYTGKQKVIDTAGMVEKYKNRLSALGQPKAVTPKPAETKKKDTKGKK